MSSNIIDLLKIQYNQRLALIGVATHIHQLKKLAVTQNEKMNLIFINNYQEIKISFWGYFKILA